tara:strand:- start:5110 stop:5388 length:279 start_codon:yes stop_codon:yes gene_type:complete
MHEKAYLNPDRHIRSEFLVYTTQSGSERVSDLHQTSCCKVCNGPQVCERCCAARQEIQGAGQALQKIPWDVEGLSQGKESQKEGLQVKQEDL